jgi:hypothetical protein
MLARMEKSAPLSKTIQQWKAYREKMLTHAREKSVKFYAGEKGVCTPYVHVMFSCPPSIADHELRNHNNANRPMENRHVVDFVSMIQKGEIQAVPSRIVICDDGDIGDGQHLFKAGVMANKSFTVEWVFGVSKAMMLVVDSNQKARTARDVTYIAHRDLADESKQSVDLLAAVGTLYDWLTCGLPLGLSDTETEPYRLSSSGLVTVTKGVPELRNHLVDGRRIADAVASARAAKKDGRKSKGYRAAFATAFALIERGSIAARNPKSPLADFKTQLEHATNQEFKNTPILIFRESILHNKIGVDRKGKNFETAIAAGVIATWNAWARATAGRGRQTITLKAIVDASHSETFPTAE